MNTTTSEQVTSNDVTVSPMMHDRHARAGLAGLAFAAGLAVLAAGCSESRSQKRKAPRSTGASQGTPTQGAANDWCVEHKLPESKCTKCNPKLIDKYKKSGDWCAGHGFPESVCPKCNPVSPPTAGVGKGSPPKDWCAEHKLPESKCTKCNPKLVDKYKKSGDWCAGHGFPESVCPKCNPVTPPTAGVGKGSPPKDWCTEHGLPESKCTKCNPSLEAKYRTAGDWCVTHGFPASACPKCNPVSPPAGTKLPPLFSPGTRIRFRTASIERAAGIATVPAAKASLDRRVSSTARIEYNRNRLADIRSPVSALVKKVAIDLGAKVHKGSALFTLVSAKIGVLKSRLISASRGYRVAKTNLKRQRALHKSGGASKRDVELARLRLAEASSTLAAISQSLRVGGISARGFSGSFKLLAPISGTVIRRPSVVGTKAGPADSLATLADTSSMWAMIEVNEWDAALARVGQPVTLRVDGLAGRVFKGKVTWVSTEVNPRTRTVRVRAEIQNSQSLLRANQFARATLEVSAPRGDVTAPVDAIQQLGNRHVVFVRLEAGVYEPREVRLGRSDGTSVHISGRVKVGDAVVTTGAFLLRTELSKDAIGAGCADGD